MDREKVTVAALKPLDLMIGAGVSAASSSTKFNVLSDKLYDGVKSLLRHMYDNNGDLTGEGLEYIPVKGGVLFVSNHQSWNDVKVIAATCPRRLRFAAKSEYRDWPILRHLITVSDSTYLDLDGNAAGMNQAVEALRAGKALVVFPEGSIPGEANSMRAEIEADTGLLPGSVDVIKLAIAAQVPIVPIGISGTGASLPPELVPRLELLQWPKSVPVTVKYGKPIKFDKYHGKQSTPATLKKLTKSLMRSISSLVDHSRSYIPMQVPKAALPQYEKLGVLLLHGFTSSVRTIDGMVPLLKKNKIPYRLPVLRGHGTHYRDLAGVTADDWYQDAEAALLDLGKEVDRVVVVGLSMGGLVALNLGMRHPDKIAGLVTLAAALRFKDPLTPLTPLISSFIKSWPSPPAFNDPSLTHTCENYPKFMTDAFSSLFDYAKQTEQNLARVKVPLCVLHSKRDQVIAPIAANIIYRDVSSSHREIHWFKKTGHEMGQDLERDVVFAQTMQFIGKFVKKKKSKISKKKV